MTSKNNTPMNSLDHNNQESQPRKSNKVRSWGKIQYFTKKEDDLYVCSKCYIEVTLSLQ